LPDTIEELKRRYRAGEHTPALSREYSISKSSLISLLRSEGVTLRRRPLATADTMRAIELYDQGLTINRVAKQTGYSFGTIRKMLHREGVLVRENCIKRDQSSDNGLPMKRQQSSTN
jgi:hypothetical protein